MTWVLFDYGGVICHPQSGEDVGLLARAAGCSVAELEAAYWPSRLDYDRADLDVTSYWQRLAAGLGRSYTDVQIAELSRLDTASWLNLQPATVDLVTRLAAAGHQLALLSNAPVDVAEAVRGLPVAASFEYLMFSCYLKVAKPDPECFRAALAVLGAEAADVVFLDDRADNVAAATAIGIRSVQFTDAAAAGAALAEHGVATA
jgi:putative hydrolase of the HAD superfamily